ncbi:MAG: ATP-binding protein, partial [Nocardioidaceae bacterium]|nr:ATP-binding protein [Nocardioidaceae bacterium]
LVVDDDGPGVPDGQHERIFERFVRLDEARGRDVGGAGIGLSIARELASERGGSLTSQQRDAGARFVLLLPLVGDEVSPRSEPSAPA